MPLYSPNNAGLFSNMPEHKIPFCFAIDTELLSLYYTQDYITRGLPSNLATLELWGVAYPATINRWYSGNVWRLGRVVADVLALFFPADVVSTIYNEDCWYLCGHEPVDECWQNFSSVDFGDSLLPYLSIDAEKEGAALSMPMYRQNLQNEGLYSHWRDLLAKYQETRISSVKELVGMLPRQYYYDFWNSYEYAIMRTLEARVFGLNASEPWCPDCRASNLYSRSPFEAGYTQLILHNRWAFRNYLLEHSRFC